VFCETDLAVSRGASYKGKKMSGDKRPIPEDDGNRDEDLPELKKPRKSLLPRLFSPFLYTAQFNSNTITTFTNVRKSSQETKMRGLKKSLECTESGDGNKPAGH
jgi:hypothetical protein